jgi:hypothetical protein
MKEEDRITVTPEELSALLAKVDAVCEQAQQLRKQIVDRMQQTRQDDQLEQAGQPGHRTRALRKKA